jgi:hypothetical protein
VGADILSKLRSTRAVVPPGVFIHELHHLSNCYSGQSTRGVPDGRVSGWGSQD